MTGRRAALAALLVPGLLLAGCATAPRPADTLSGRLLVRVDAAAGQPAKSLSSAFELSGGAERGDLRLTSPLGTLVAQARWSPEGATLTTADGEARYADLDELARVALGEALPLRALPEWLRGRPWAGAPAQVQAQGFEQLGWQVGLARRAEGWIEATRSTAPAVTVRAKLDKPE